MRTISFPPEYHLFTPLRGVQSDTILKAFFLAMSLYPEAQKKAQAELDSVVGKNRLPDLSDRDKLVYVNAILKELLRWMPPAPLGLSHSTLEDDEMCGYFVPKGTMLLANIWCVDVRIHAAV